MKDAYEPIMPQLIAQRSHNSKALPSQKYSEPSFPSSSSTSASSTHNDVVKKKANTQSSTRNPRVVAAAEKFSTSLEQKVIEERNQLGALKRDRDLHLSEDREPRANKRSARSQDIEDGELE